MLNAISKQLFWDCDLDAVDEQKHKNFIIVRVMERGDIADVREIWEFYKRADIEHALLSARTLSPKTVSFFSKLLGVERQNFRACRRKAEECTTWP
jgi:hypothetical protein